jgi:hypothetical protein
MELFGAKFSVALGAWNLRFVLMLEDAEDVPQSSPAPPRAPHHYASTRNTSQVR